MKKLATAIAAVALIGTSAFAAAPKKKIIPPPPPPAPVYSWTGFYVGGNVGYSWGNARADIAGEATNVSLPNSGGGGVTNAFGLAGSQAAHPTGVIGGAHAGYNYQISPQAVLGLEADIQGSGERGTTTSNTPFSPTLCTSTFFIPPGPADDCSDFSCS
jgi:outer membrane immunogenic protein